MIFPRLGLLVTLNIARASRVSNLSLVDCLAFPDGASCWHECREEIVGNRLCRPTADEPRRGEGKVERWQADCAAWRKVGEGVAQQSEQPDDVLDLLTMLPT